MTQPVGAVKHILSTDVMGIPITLQLNRTVKITAEWRAVPMEEMSVEFWQQFLEKNYRALFFTEWLSSV